MQRPNLSPQQSLENQVQICGEIDLARRCGRGIRPDHEKTARREYPKMLTHQGPEAALYAVTDNRGPNRTTDDKAYLRRLGWANHAKTDVLRGWGGWGCFGYQQMPGQRCATDAAPSADRAPEIGWASHPRLPRQHLRLPSGSVRR
jgi:hypothetical protein